MSAPIPQPLPEPLRLPRGSVRGGIAVIVTATYGYLLLSGVLVPTVLVNAVVVVIAFYFGSHPPPPPKPPGQAPPPHPKLVRIVLLFAFLGLTLWFLRLGLSLAVIPRDLRGVLEVLGGYVAGALVSWFVHRRAHESPIRGRLAILFRDSSAAAALGLTAYICYALTTRQTSLVAGHAEDALSLVVTFYFGSRVLGH